MANKSAAAYIWILLSRSRSGKLFTSVGAPGLVHLRDLSPDETLSTESDTSVHLQPDKGGDVGFSQKYYPKGGNTGSGARCTIIINNYYCSAFTIHLWSC